MTAGIRRSWRYTSEKIARYREGKKKAAQAAKDEKEKKD